MRIPLAVMIAAPVAAAALGVFLMVVALVGFENWSTGQRAIALGLGAVDALGMGLFAGLIWRQQVLGRPPVALGEDGVDIGGHVIPWDEIDDVAQFSVYGLPHVVLAQTPSAPRRLRGLGRLHYLTRKGAHFVVLAERQLGQDVASAEVRIRIAWLRYRPGPTADTTGREADG